jgi:O-antigen/teichoic acid export membrane protein
MWDSNAHDGSLQTATRAPASTRESAAGPAHTARSGRQMTGSRAQITGTLNQITGTFKAVTNSAAVLAAQIISKLGTFVTFLIVSLSLPLQQLGSYTLVLAVGEIFSSVASFGIDQILMRMLAREDTRSARKRLLRDAVVLKLVCSLIAGGVALAALLWIGVAQDLLWGVSIVMADVVLANVAASLTSYYRARLDSRTPAVAQGITQMLYVAALLVCAMRGVSWLVLLDLLLCSDALLCLLLARKLGSQLGPIVLREPARHRELFAEAVPLGIVAVGVLLYTRLDTVLLAHWRGSEQVAYYGIAYKLTEAPLAVAATIAVTALPMLSAWSMEHPDRVRGAIQRALRYSYAVTLLAAVTLSFFSRELIAALYGSRFASAAPAVAVLVWGTVAMASNIVTAAVLTALGRQRLLTPLVVLNLALNMALNLWAIPHWGFFGSAVATTATEGLNAVIQIVVLCWVLRQPQLATTTLVGGALGAICVTGYFMAGERPAPVLGLGAVAATLLVLAIFRLVVPDDWHRLRRTGGRLIAHTRPGARVAG